MGVKCCGTFSPIATKSYHLHFEAWICMEKFEVKIHTNGKNTYTMLFIASNREILRGKRQTKARDIYPLLQRTLFGICIFFVCAFPWILNSWVEYRTLKESFLQSSSSALAKNKWTCSSKPVHILIFLCGSGNGRELAAKYSVEALHNSSIQWWCIA